MKHISVILLLVLIASSPVASQQQPSFSGRVSIHNSGFRTGKVEYVDNAQVKDDFSRANLAITRQGKFLLVYPHVAAGKDVSFSVSRPGLQVVDPTKLHAVTGQTDTVQISMANPDSINDYRAQLFSIGKTAATRALEKSILAKNHDIELLKKQSSANRQTIQALQLTIDSLEKQRSSIDENAEQLARKYSLVNLDTASALLRKAFGLFQAGRFSSAMSLLDSADLPGEVKAIQQERESINKEDKALKARKAKEREQTKKASEGLTLKAQLLMLQFEVDSVAACYELLLQLDPNNADYLYDYALFSGWTGHFDKSITLYRQALTGSEDERSKAAILLELGNMYLHKSYSDTALLYYKSSLDMCRALMTNDPANSESLLVSNLSNIGTVLKDINQFDSSLLYFSQALAIVKKRPDSANAQWQLMKASLLNNQGLIYMRLKQLRNAQDCFKAAIRLDSVLTGIDTGYLPLVARSLFNLADLYWLADKPIPANANLLQALQVVRQLYGRLPSVYHTDFSLAIELYGKMKLWNDKPDSAIALFRQSIAVFEPFAQTDSTGYLSVAANNYNNIATSYKSKDQYDSTIYYLNMSAQVYQQLSQYNPAANNLGLAIVDYNLGSLYNEQNEYVKSEAFLLRAFQLDSFRQTKVPLIDSEHVVSVATQLLNVYTQVSDSLKGDFIKTQFYRNFQKVAPRLEFIAKIGGMKYDLARLYSQVIWDMLLNKNTEGAYQIALATDSLGSGYYGLTKNRAHAILYSGHYEAAVLVYSSLKKIVNQTNKLNAQNCMDDFALLKKAGLSNKHTKDVIEMFKVD